MIERISDGLCLSKLIGEVKLCAWSLLMFLKVDEAPIIQRSILDLQGFIKLYPQGRNLHGDVARFVKMRVTFTAIMW